MAILLVIVLARGWLQVDEPPQPSPLVEGGYAVQRVVDGDTLLLDNRARVRLIGVDTPETKKPDHPVEPWGPEASAFTQSFLEAGRVRLTFDRERLDRHGRYLAYAWSGDRLLNEELIRAGLGRAQLQYSYSSPMKRRFRAAEQAAKREQRGMWSTQQPSGKEPRRAA